MTMVMKSKDIGFNCYKVFYSYIDQDTGDIVHTNVTVVSRIVTRAVDYVKKMYKENEEWCLEKVEVVE